MIKLINKNIFIYSACVPLENLKPYSNTNDVIHHNNGHHYGNNHHNIFNQNSIININNVKNVQKVSLKCIIINSFFEYKQKQFIFL
jgi:hypothetical protein